METVNASIFPAIRQHADRTMQVHRERSWTYGDAARAIHGVAEALRERGIRPGDRVALVDDNSPRWMHTYLGILATGAVAVPRGAETSENELRYIVAHSESKLAFVGNEGIAERIPGGVPTVALDDDERFPAPREPDEEAFDRYARARGPEDIAVLIYTSGTTGKPKGVVLEQRNIAHNLRVLPDLVDIRTGDVWVSILPPWHVFEQTVELCAFHMGCTTIYSDKRRLKEDLRKQRPQFFAAVPRVWSVIYDGAMQAIRKRGAVVEKLFHLALRGSRAWKRGNPLGLPLHLLGKSLFYKKVVAATGGRLKYAISGGGYLPPHVDEFFNLVGVDLLVGYGLTETAPVVALRVPDDNVLGTIGRAVPDTEIRISDRGTIQVRGPQVMRGYYKDPELTESVLDDDGWFDTGDLGRMTEKGDLVFVGRAKETIVLAGGENVEPEPIENRILQSPLVSQAMLVGQDHKTLGALIVPDPDHAADRDLESKIREELGRRTGPTAGFAPYERVARFRVVDEPFTPENGLLTQTLKMKRNEIATRYAHDIEAMFGA